MNLTATAIKNARPIGKTQKLFDGRGLYLEISPTGGKWWRFKYRYEGKEKRLSLGIFPDISLQQARERREDARKMLAVGVDPSEHRKAQKEAKKSSAANSFEVVAREWFDKYSARWSPNHIKISLQRLEKDISPWIGVFPISEIRPSKMLKVVRRIEALGASGTAHRLLGTCSRVFSVRHSYGTCCNQPL